MKELVDIVLASGRTAVDLVLYVLLPIMVVMMAAMKLLDAKGVLGAVARLLSPLLVLFGIPGLGAFALLQVLFVSFAAPVATLSVMQNNGVGERRIAATLAAILAMSQANAVFPLVAVGLNYSAVLATSFVGAFVASTLTYRVFAKGLSGGISLDAGSRRGPREGGVLRSLLAGGREGLALVVRSTPVLVLSIFLVDVLRAIGGVSLLEWCLSPALDQLDLPSIAVLPLATKYLAGGTAMSGVTLGLVREGALSAAELNRIAGLLINPLDIVGLAVLTSYAKGRVPSVVRPAVLGAAAGVLVRGVLHLALF